MFMLEKKNKDLRKKIKSHTQDTNYVWFLDNL